MKNNVEIAEKVQKLQSILVDGIKVAEEAQYYPESHQRNLLIYIGEKYKKLLKKINTYKKYNKYKFFKNPENIDNIESEIFAFELSAIQEYQI